MSDINSLYYRKSLKQREIAQSQSKIHKYEKRIERLKDYKRKVANYKEDIFDIINLKLMNMKIRLKG